jgi:hypothetical protein
MLTMVASSPVAAARAEWWRETIASARTGDRAARFPSPSRAALLRQLRTEAQRDGFRIVGVRFLRPLQAAPVVVLQSDDEARLARAVPRIVAAFDRRRPTAADPAGTAYEAYFLVAETRAGVPYLATFDHERAPHVGGGEWAARESLYPFPHG